MENKKNNSIVVVLIIIIILLLMVFGILFVTGTIQFKGKGVNLLNQNKDVINNSNDGEIICPLSEYEKLVIVDMVDKESQERAIGGETLYYNVNTKVTKNYNYTPNENDLYVAYYSSVYGEPLLFLTYNNKLYYTTNKELFEKYCENDSNVEKKSCEYSKINDNNIKDFINININLDIKSIGIYRNSGSGVPIPFVLTNNGQVISFEMNSNNEYSKDNCKTIYNDNNNPIEKIFSWNLYNISEYSVLLKDGTLINREVDWDNRIVKSE